jgi:hypothetical protein
MMSDPNDKLIAISAISQRIGARVKLRYIAGLWDLETAAQLLWSSRDAPKKRSEKYRAPSWSWASIDAQIEPLVLNSGDRLLEVLKVNVEPRDPDFEYGAVV